MKIRKGEYIKDYESTANPEEYIKQPILLFSPFIKSRQINVNMYRSFNLDEGQSIKGDWKAFSMATFNLIQNCVKYNKM